MEEQNIATVDRILAARNAGDVGAVLADEDDLKIESEFTHFPTWPKEPVISARAAFAPSSGLVGDLGRL